MTSMPPPPGEAVGTVLNRQWRLTRLIGEGGLAAVYEAEGLQRQGQRAIKMLHPQFHSQPSIIERFYTEGKTCFSLRHPHIASVESYAYAEDGSPYLVMELLRGMSLEEYLARGQPMPEAQAIVVMYGVLQALSVAHARGIIHRDLKPGNLFLVPERGEYAVKVLDFGIAKVMDAAGGMGSKTRTGAVLGTPGYMSPEQIKNAKAVDPRTDLWAVGVVLYEMLCRVHPFGAENNVGRMVAVLSEPPRPISEVDPALAKWDAFFQQALAREPATRFQSAEEMGDALRSVAAQQPEAPKLEPQGYQTVALPIPLVAPSSMPPPGMMDGSMVAVPGPPPTGMQGVQPVAHTKISGDKPEGTPTLAERRPQVGIAEAEPLEPPALVWWAVLLVSIACFALGLAAGYQLAVG